MRWNLNSAGAERCDAEKKKRERIVDLMRARTMPKYMTTRWLLGLTLSVFLLSGSAMSAWAQAPDGAPQGGDNPVAEPMAAEPLAAPVAPVATAEPLAEPVEPMAAPVEPVAAPVEPIGVPVEPSTTTEDAAAQTTGAPVPKAATNDTVKSAATEKISGLSLMVAAYIAIWLGLFFYVLTLLSRQRRVGAEIAELRERFKSLDERIRNAR